MCVGPPPAVTFGHPVTASGLHGKGKSSLFLTKSEIFRLNSKGNTIDIESVRF